MTGAHWLLLAACAGFAVLVVLLRWRWPRLRASDAEDSDRMAREMRQWADEPGDPTHEQIDQALDIATEVDRAKADHLNAAMRAVDHPYTHLTPEEVADCAGPGPDPAAVAAWEKWLDDLGIPAFGHGGTLAEALVEAGVEVPNE